MALDIRARWGDYIYYRVQVGTSKNLTKLQASWCGRGVAQAIWPHAQGFYYWKGYRWWNILPDGFPAIFLKKKFWKKVVLSRGDTERNK